MRLLHACCYRHWHHDCYGDGNGHRDNVRAWLQAVHAVLARHLCLLGEVAGPIGRGVRALHAAGAVHDHAAVHDGAHVAGAAALGKQRAVLRGRAVRHGNGAVHTHAIHVHL